LKLFLIVKNMHEFEFFGVVFVMNVQPRLLLKVRLVAAEDGRRTDEGAVGAQMPQPVGHVQKTEGKRQKTIEKSILQKEINRSAPTLATRKKDC
jgi:hypothetical protein